MNEEQLYDRTARIEHLEFQREEAQAEKEQVEFLINKVEDIKSSLSGTAKEQIILFLTKLKSECNNLQDIEEEIRDSIYFVQGY